MISFGRKTGRTLSQRAPVRYRLTTAATIMRSSFASGRDHFDIASTACGPRQRRQSLRTHRRLRPHWREFFSDLNLASFVSSGPAAAHRRRSHITVRQWLIPTIGSIASCRSRTWRCPPSTFSRRQHPLTSGIAEKVEVCGTDRRGLAPELRPAAAATDPFALTSADVADHDVGHDGWRMAALDDAAHAEAALTRTIGHEPQVRGSARQALPVRRPDPDRSPIGHISLDAGRDASSSTANLATKLLAARRPPNGARRG